MPLVFVHGVGVRKNLDYDKRVSRRDSLFRRFGLKQIVRNWKHFDIVNPYWGDDAAQFRWNNASLPSGNEEVLGGLDQEIALLLAESHSTSATPGSAVVTTAHSAGLTDAIDLLWTTTSHTGADSASPDLAYLAERALAYARSNPRPDWLTNVEDDQSFITELREHIEESPVDMSDAPGTEEPGTKIEVLGLSEVWDSLREAAGRIAAAVPAAASSAVLSVARKTLHLAVSTFLGDVMVYLHQRDRYGAESPIVKRVLDGINSAREIQNVNKEPLIVIAHSMGGNILYDIFTYFRPDLKVDMFVTVGSQPALFEELKLFKISDPSIPKTLADRAPAPQAVSKWLNIFDTNDILSFAAAGVFARVIDFKYSTGQDLFHAHSSYFNRPSFQERLGARIQEAWSK